MPHTYTFKQIKEYLNTLPELKFRSLNELPEKVGLQKFLSDFFRVYNKAYATVYVKNGHVQTQAGKRRSIGDIFIITKYYFPKVAITTIYKALLTNIKTNKFFSFICLATQKRMYRDESGQVYGGGGFFNGELVDEFGVDFEMFDEYDESYHNLKGFGQDHTKDNLKLIEF